MESKQNIPQHWKVKRLGEVCAIIMGQSPSSDTYNFEKVGLPFFQGKAEFTEFYPTPVKWCSKPNKIAKPNDILLSVRAPVGATNVANVECCIGRGLAAIRYENWKYILFFLRAIEKELDKKGTGTTFRAISGEILRNTLIPIPPLPEQQSIVSKIEELFSELDNSVEQLKLAQQQLKTYRQSVLKAAFEGKLTEEWRTPHPRPLSGRRGEQDITEMMAAAEPDVEYGKAASGFADGQDVKGNQKNISRKSSHPENHGSDNLPEGWKWVKSGEIIDTINNGYTPKKDSLTEGKGDIPFIKVYNLNFDGTLNYTKNPTFIPKHIHEKNLKRSICYPGDVLINIVGPPLGKVSILTDEYPEWNINQAIVLFRPNEKILSKYISYFLQNIFTINWLEDTSKATAGQWNVKVSTCREIPIPLPPINEQQQIVSEIESRLSVADKMEETIAQSLQQAAALKQSILKQAFEGRLVKAAKNTAKIIPFERKVLAGKIIHLLYNQPHFGLTKFQKTLFVVEHHAQVIYPIYYDKYAAGPYDSYFTHAFREEMLEKDWFREETKILVTHFVPGDNVGSLIKEYAKYFREKAPKIVSALKLFKDKTLEDAELVATLYACWNNRIIRDQVLHAELLIQDIYDWSERKKKYTAEEIIFTYHWMGKVGLVPTGFGRYV